MIYRIVQINRWNNFYYEDQFTYEIVTLFITLFLNNQYNNGDEANDVNEIIYIQILFPSVNIGMLLAFYFADYLRVWLTQQITSEATRLRLEINFNDRQSFITRLKETFCLQLKIVELNFSLLSAEL